MRFPPDPTTSAVDLAAAIRDKQVSPVEVVDMYLDRMDDLDPSLNAFCHRDDDRVRADARAAADAVVHAAAASELPPFHGVPLPIKDLVDVAGWPTTFGSAGAGRTPAATSSPIVQRFVAAGFIPLGKTTTSEFGAVPFTESPALGISRNPWDLDRTPGGSSSGAAVAVAAAMAPIAHAGDGGGSIRIPASCTGLVGLKPTRGLVSNGPIEAAGLATHGVLTRHVADTAAALDVLARHDATSWWSPPTPRTSYRQAMTAPAPVPLRIGVMTQAPIEGLVTDPACTAAVDLTVRLLESLGHHVVDRPLPLPPAEELIDAFTTLWNVGGAGIPLADPDAIEPHNRVLRDAARDTDSWTYAEELLHVQQLSRRIIEPFLADLDILVTPTMACLPPPVGFWRREPPAPMAPLLYSYPMAVFTSLFNVTGQPAISLPIHHDPTTALPVGVQLVAAPWREDLLLQLSHTLELELAWTDRRAPLATSARR